MIRIENEEFCAVVESNINSYIKVYSCWRTESGVCFIPFGDFVEVYESENDLIENA